MTIAGPRHVFVAAPGEPAYETATRVFNLAAPARPAAAVTARTLDEVRAAVRYAESEGLGVRVHATGHAAGSVAPMDGALLIRTRLAGGVEVDPGRRVARVPAGARWREVVEAAAPHGLAAPHGSSPTVGVVGYLLRGGVSFYGRKVGVAANGVRAVELVTAGGDVRRVDAASDPELLWALRGGGGGFGVVTSVELDLFPARGVVTGAAFWPAAHAPRLLRLWRRWARHAPWEAATSVRILNLPDLPEIPAELRAGPVLCLAGVVLAGDHPASAPAQAEELLGPLRSAAPPLLDTWRPARPAEVLETHMDPTEPVALHGDHLLLGEIGDDAVDAFCRVTGEGSGSPLVSAELRQLGGALAVPVADGGALDHIDACYAYMGAGLPEGPESEEAIGRRFALVRAALAPWDTGRTAPTFVESTQRPQGHLTAEQVETLDRVRRRVDPPGLFRGDVTPGASAAA
ncbi:FAD-binding oxidoreductase [Microbispora corallina]|uniref:FAD-linked oxidase n=1 Tax=Microbispora corallina TaxID=83302 RepID=A0ABQ4FYV7_9ACTN|nr:FAD-dependent oxidoreductase [Microbispora corallina]GIH40004.1 FAD-linked oxidase [Microbispora corallina]